MKVDPTYNGRVDRPGMAYQTGADDSGAPPSSRTLDPQRFSYLDADPLMGPQVIAMGIGLSADLPSIPTLNFGA